MSSNHAFGIRTARRLFAISGVLGTICTPALVLYGVRTANFHPPYGGAIWIFGLLFLASVACLTGIWKPRRWIALAASAIFFGLGLLIAPSTGGLFQLLALPVGCVAAFGIDTR